MIVLTFEQNYGLFTEEYETFEEALKKISSLYKKDRKSVGLPAKDGRLELRGLNGTNLKEVGILASFANNIANNDRDIRLKSSSNKLKVADIERAENLARDLKSKIKTVSDKEIIEMETIKIWQQASMPELN